MAYRSALPVWILLALTALSARAVAAESPVTARTGARKRAMTALLATRPTFSAAGVGLYPIHVEFHAAGLALSSHVALGGSANVIRARAGSDADPSSKVIGAVAQARLAVGGRWQAERNFALSVELGYAPWAHDLVVRAPGPATAASVVDLSVSLEWR